MSSEQRTSSFIFLKQRLMPFSSEVISASSSGQITCAPKFSVHPLKREHLGLPFGLNWKRQAVLPPLPSLSACWRGRSAGQSQRLGSRRDQASFRRGHPAARNSHPSVTRGGAECHRCALPADRHAPGGSLHAVAHPGLRIALAPGCHLCCRHEVVPTPFHPISLQSPAEHETAILDSSSQRPFQSRPSRAPLPSPSARPEPGLEPVVADWREEGGVKNKAGGGGCGAG